MGLPVQKQINEPTIKLPPNRCKQQAVSRKSICKILRYPALLGEQWQSLPGSIQHRFLKWTPERKSIIYTGRLLETRFSKAGRYLSALCAFLGSPLPIKDNIRGPATVIVQETRKKDGQIWTRIYPRADKTPQVIQSIKMFSGKTGLEEMISPHMGISLNLVADAKSLSFISERYFYKIYGWRISLPNWLAPGRLKVTHRELGPKRFRFTLELTHKFLGELIFQTAIFEELEQ